MHSHGSSACSLGEGTPLRDPRGCPALRLVPLLGSRARGCPASLGDGKPLALGRAVFAALVAGWARFARVCRAEGCVGQPLVGLSPRGTSSLILPRLASFRAAFPRPTRLRGYASTPSLPSTPQGSPPTCRLCFGRKGLSTAGRRTESQALPHSFSPFRPALPGRTGVPLQGHHRSHDEEPHSAGATGGSENWLQDLERDGRPGNAREPSGGLNLSRAEANHDPKSSHAPAQP